MSMTVLQHFKFYANTMQTLMEKIRQLTGTASVLIEKTSLTFIESDSSSSIKLEKSKYGR